MADKKNPDNRQTCGIIMPISLIDGCSAEHWADILGILKDVCEANDLVPNLVSDADDIGVIHNRIIENIYSSDIIICDVSCKNANVMFELGMRLAFDKPTIIIKDNVTGYSFDTSLIEHIEYPRDLRFTSIIKFKDNLGKKLKATLEKAKSDPNYSTFLKNFGKYKIAKLEDREITSDTFIMNAIEELRRDVKIIRTNSINDNEIFRLDKNRNNNILGKPLSIDGQLIFKKYVQDYLKEKNISKRPKELNLRLSEIVDDLENIEELRNIAGDPVTLRRYVEDSLY